MTFFAHPDLLRTFDEERGYELFSKGGSSDATHTFLIVGPEGEYNFFARNYKEKLNSSEITKIGLDDYQDYVVWNIGRWSPQWKAIIAESLLAYRIAHGNLSKKIKVFVRFGEELFYDA